MSKSFLLETQKCLQGCFGLHENVKNGKNFKTIATTLAIATIGMGNPSFATNNPEIQPVIQQATEQVQNYQNAWDSSVEEVNGENPFLTYQKVIEDANNGKYNPNDAAEKQFVLSAYENYRFKTLLTNTYTPTEFKERLVTFVKGEPNNVLMDNLHHSLEKLPEDDSIFDVMGKTFKSKSDPTLSFNMMELRGLFADDMATKKAKDFENKKSGIDLLVKIVSAASTGGVSLLLGDINPLSFLGAAYQVSTLSEKNEYDKFRDTYGSNGGLPKEFNIYKENTFTDLNNTADKLNIPSMVVNTTINAFSDSSTETNPPNETQALVLEQQSEPVTTPVTESSIFSVNREDLSNRLSSISNAKESIPTVDIEKEKAQTLNIKN